MIRRLAPIIVLAGLVCVLLWPVLISGRVLLPGAMLGKMSPWNASAADGDIQWNALTWDSIAYFYPARALLGRAVRSGELPLWNPHQMCGMPFLADGQSAVLYLPNLLFALLPPDRAFGLLAAFHLFAAGLFTYIFLRGLSLGRAAAVFGGIGFMLSGFAVIWLELPVFLSTGVWLPLALHCSRLAYERRSALWAAGAGTAVALSLVGGHPQIAFYCVLAVALYWIYMGVSSMRAVEMWRSFWLACLTFAVGFALAAPQLFPSAELAALSHRGGSLPTSEGYSAYSALAMPFGNLIALLMPDFFGNPSKGTFWGPGEFAEYTCYVGILPLLLLPLAFGCGSACRKQSWFFGGLALLALLMALGTGINRLLYFYIPGFSRSGSPARVFFLLMFSIVVLGAMGLDRVLGDPERKRARGMGAAAFSALGVLAVGLVLLQWNLGRFAGVIAAGELLGMSLPVMYVFSAFFLSGAALILLIAAGRLGRGLGGVLLLGLLAADLLAFGMWYNLTCKPSEVYPATELTSFLAKDAGSSRIMPLNEAWALREFPKSMLPPNSAAVYGLCDVQGYDSLYPVRYKELLDAAGGRDSCPRENGNMVFAMNPQSPVYDLLGVRWVISTERPAGEYKELDGCYLYRNPDPLPRAFVVHAIEYAEDGEILRRIVRGEVDVSAVALVDPKDGGQFALRRSYSEHDAGDVRAGEARIVKYACNKVDVEVETGQPGILVLTDQYYPGWQARVDGELTPIVRTDYAFRGVAVPPGAHMVAFSYSPRSFAIGLRCMKVALALMGALAIWAVVRRGMDRRRQAAGPRRKGTVRGHG